MGEADWRSWRPNGRGSGTLAFVDDAERERLERAAARRRSWTVRKVALEEDGGEELLAGTTASERLGMMWRLALDAWASAGEPIPDYPRSEAPGRVIRADD